MSIFKAFKFVAKLGEVLVNAFESVVDFADHVIHKKEYERQAKKRKIFWTIFLSVAGGIAAILLVPYRLIVKRNGDFEIRTLLLRVYRLIHIQAPFFQILHQLSLLTAGNKGCPGEIANLLVGQTKCHATNLVNQLQRGD